MYVCVRARVSVCMCGCVRPCLRPCVCVFLVMCKELLSQYNRTLQVCHKIYDRIDTVLATRGRSDHLPAGRSMQRSNSNKVPSIMMMWGFMSSDVGLTYTIDHCVSSFLYASHTQNIYASHKNMKLTGRI